MEWSSSAIPHWYSLCEYLHVLQDAPGNDNTFKVIKSGEVVTNVTVHIPAISCASSERSVMLQLRFVWKLLNFKCLSSASWAVKLLLGSFSSLIMPKWCPMISTQGSIYHHGRQHFIGPVCFKVIIATALIAVLETAGVPVTGGPPIFEFIGV